MLKAPLQQIFSPELLQKKVSVYIKREDLLHPRLSGNKYRKLKYNLLSARERGYDRLLTFGGAYSNHIHATALAGKDYGFNTIGVIRGEELAEKWEENPTLREAAEAGMRFKFIPRTAYKNKVGSELLVDLEKVFGKFYLLPEGGTNELAIKGCEEILNKEDSVFNHICCSVGTGGTLAGVVNSSSAQQKVHGFPALKGDFLKEDIRKFTTRENWDLQAEYHFGGYARVTEPLISFVNGFNKTYGIALEPIYTGKMMFGLFDLIQNDFFTPDSKIMAIHTGGLQGIEGMNRKLKMKNLPLIEI